MFENPRRGRQANAECRYSENSRSQIVFRTDIFQKLTLGAANLCFRWDGEKDLYIITIRFSAGDGDLDRLLLALMGTLNSLTQGIRF